MVWSPKETNTTDLSIQIQQYKFPGTNPRTGFQVPMVPQPVKASLKNSGKKPLIPRSIK
jgi:hypothetical protein